MKIFTRFFDPKTFEQKLKEYNNLNFSLFIDDVPKSNEDLSKINIIALVEPNEYFGIHDWVIQNKHLFNAILTWNDKILNNCENAIFLPFGHTWFKPDQYEKEHKKEFKIAHLRGSLLKSYGHQIRWEILNRKDEIKIPTKFFETYGDRHNPERAGIDKEEVFGDAQFGVAIENFAHRGWFSEKILDCFLLKTIPMYWGCSNIGDFFNTDGIIKFGEADEFIYISNQLTDSYYNSKKDIIEKNYQLALQYVNYEDNISNKIHEIFKLNNL